MSFDVSKFVGLPWREHGRDFDGLDCWGLVYLIYLHELRIELPSYVDEYENTVDAKHLKKVYDQNMTAWSMLIHDQPRIFDVALMRVRGHPIHVGIYLEPGKMLHIEDGLNSVIEAYNGLQWQNRLIGFFRHERRFDSNTEKT